jgi:hypothetical protein
MMFYFSTATLDNKKIWSSALVVIKYTRKRGNAGTTMYSLAVYRAPKK